jgi:hypothetical protein
MEKNRKNGNIISRAAKGVKNKHSPGYTGEKENSVAERLT